MRPSRLLLASLAGLLLGACGASPAVAPRLDAELEPVPIAEEPTGSRSLLALRAHEPVIVPAAGARDRLIARGWSDAIDDIRHAALTADAEDGWVGIRRGSLWLWKDIAIEESETTASYRFRPGDPDFAGADELVFVHFHPVRRVVRGALVPLYRAMSRDRELSVDAFWWTVHREEYLFRVPPSLTDFQADARIVQRMTGVPVRSVVVTALAAYTFRSTADARRWLLAEPAAARAAWTRATRGLTSLEQLLERLEQLGLQVDVEPLPGSDWDALKHWFLAELRRHHAGPR